MTDDGLRTLLEALTAQGVAAQDHRPSPLAPAALVHVAPDDWQRLARAAAACGWRWAAGWGEDAGVQLLVNACFALGDAHVVARAAVARAQPALPSQAPVFPAAERPERHAQDLLGVVFTDLPDGRRWSRHQAWRATEHPLRRDFPAAGRSPGTTPADHGYPFMQAQGAGVYEIPVGPVHAGIIEPGHFRFQAVGETVLNLEARLGYVHKGIEKIGEGRDPERLARLAGRVSGDATVAHAWAACLAMERACGIEAPPRAAFLRAVMAERERIANHLGDIGAVLNDVAFTFGFHQFSRLREEWQRLSRAVFGHRLLMGRVVPGGVAVDIDRTAIEAMRAELGRVRTALDRLIRMVDDSTSVEDRLVGTGVLAPAHAAALGCLGYVGRASGVDLDLRRDAPCPPYDRLTVSVPVRRSGDVAARVQVRVEECRVAFGLLESLLERLPDGPVRAPWSAPAPGAEGLGLVESWRGEVLTHVRFDGSGRIARFFPRDPSWTTWPALELLIDGNIVPDFPVCNKSVNASYSGHDL